LSHRRFHLRALLPFLVLLASIPAAADITNASLEIQGIGLSLVAQNPPVTTGIDMPTTVQTKFGGKENDEALAIEGLLAVGDLTGPGLDAPLELSTAPGHKFQIPGLSREGTYRLQNVRLMKGSELLQYATPSSAEIIVSDLFKTTVEVRQLTPDEIRLRGIVIDQRNFEVYEYTLSFLLRGETIKIPFPVIIDTRTRAVQLMPVVSPYTLPPIGTIGVGRWTPPDVIPVSFIDEPLPEEERNSPKIPKEPGEKLYVRPPIPAAIVIPNSLAVMHQFFVVSLSVQNGAPSGSTARLENVSARIRVPSQLRTATSKPAVALGQAVPLVDTRNGVTILVAQAKAEAEWSVEALKPGTHTIEIELRGTLKENGQEDVPMVARPRASVVVHDARFNIAFSHPEVVRKGIEYTTYSFITNSSPAQQTIILSNGVPPCSTAPIANVCRVDGGASDPVTIPSGETRTVEYKLRSGVTGKVFATAVHIDSEVAQATAQLHMGVSDTGIPLSPTTLIMPHYAQYVSDNLVAQSMQILGLGYSLATAPVTAATAKQPRVIKSDVYRRAVDIAQAGQAIFLANDAPGSKADAIAALSVDLLGNQANLSEWDALRRQQKYARPAGAAVTRELEAVGFPNGTTYATFIDNFGKALSHRDGYVAALVHGPKVAGNARPYALSVRGITSNRRMDIPAEAESGWVRDLPYGELTRISAPGSDREGELALVGRWTDEELEVIVTPSVDGMFDIELLYPNTTNGSTMRAHVNVNGTAGIPVRVPLSRGATTINALTPSGGFADSETATAIPLETLRVVGMRQDLHLDEDGHKVSVLFNRPVASGTTAANLVTKFHGEIDFNKDGVVWMDEPRPISGAALQESGRVIDLTFDHVLTTNASYTIELDPLVDPRTTLPASFPGEFLPKIDNDRPSGIIYGRFIRGDNSPLGKHEVILFAGLPNPLTYGAIFEEFENPKRRLPVNPYMQPPQIATTREDGSYLFEFVRRDLEAGFSGEYRLWGTADNLTKYTYINGTVRLINRVTTVNLQLLGRGSAEGTVRFDNGEIAKKVNVTVGSTAFEGVRTATTDDNGFYRVEDLPVGPLAFTATDGSGNIGYAAGEIAVPGEIEQQDISIFRQPTPKNGSVHGTIRRSDTGAPVMGASVGIFNNGYPLQTLTTDSDGRYTAEKVPAGFISVVAAEWTVSRQSANTDFDLRGDESRQVDLTLSVAANEQLATVTGEVLREDPLFPGNELKYQRVPGALVKIDSMRIVIADAEGRFVIPDVPLTPAGRNIGAHDPATRRTERVPLPTLSGNGTANVKILLKGLGQGTIRAKLFDARGVPASGFEMLVKAGGSYFEMIEVGNGVYELDKMAAGGDYLVRTGSVPGEYGDQEVTSPPVRVAFDGQIVSVSLRLPGQGEVRVKVKGISLPTDGGEPILTSLISDVSLVYNVFNSSTLTNEPKEILGTTNQNGLPGEAIFPAVPALRQYSVGSNHPLGSSGANGRLAFDADLGSHTLTLSNLGFIMGTVYAIDGVTPVPGATIRMDDEHQDQGVVTTGLDGKFEFRNVAPGARVHLVAESTQAGVYRTGERWTSIPGNGGIVNASVTLLERGQIEGKIVYGAYKVYDPLHPENNVPDNTPSDLSDNAPVPMARFWMRELDFPRRDIGTGVQPLNADLAGRFAIDNVFVGRLRATAWDPSNPDLRGDWTATLVREGELLTPYIAIGGGGTGALVATVTNPNQNNAPVENAEVQLFRGGLFDVASSGPDGKVRFEQLPVGDYVVAAYSKALGKSGRAPDTVEVETDAVAEARVMLTFSGQVTGRLTDPEATPASSPVPGSHVTISMAEGFQQRFTTNALGEYLFEGVREGLFTLDAKDTASNRRARASYLLTAADPEPVVNLELERTETLHVAVYLPDDLGANSGVLAGPVEATVKQRQGEFHRSQQGNPIVMSKLFLNETYEVAIQELGGDRRQLGTAGRFPKGSAAQPISLVYPAYGSGEVLVRRLGAAVADARVSVRVSKYDIRVFYTDAAGRIFVSGLPLGKNYSVTVTTLDGSSGSGNLEIIRTSVTGSLTVEVGSRAALTGKVLAEKGGPSVGTPVVINFSGGQLTATTDHEGSFTFAGVAAPSGIELRYYGEDGSTLGRFYSFHLGGEWAGKEYTVPTVTLDATPPLLLDIAPAQGAGAVPPDSHLKFVFSEKINTSTVHNDHFSLQPADGTPRVNATFAFADGANGTFIVTMVPPAPPAGQQFPLKSNTLYRLTVSQHVRDLTGHALGTDRGLTFTTADYIEPRVIATVPEAGTPIPEQITYEFRFNEPLDPAPFAAGGAGRVQLDRMSGPELNATVVENIPGDAYIDPFTGISLFFAPSNATLANSFYRIKFSGVRDLQGNVVPEQTYRLVSYDTFKPFVILSSPVPGDGSLVSGLTYQLLPDIRNGDATGTPALDIDLVDFFRVENGVETFIKRVRKAPFAYDFVAPDAPVAGLTLTFRASATDTSVNESAKTELSLTVKPNQAPTISVALDRTTNVFAGERVNATLTATDEVLQINLQLDVKATRMDGTDYRKLESRTLNRSKLSDPWPTVTIAVDLPTNLKGGTPVTFTGIATDMSGLTRNVTEPITLTVDTVAPAFVSITPDNGTELAFGGTYQIAANVTDVGTGVASVTFNVDGTTYTVAKAAAVGNVFTSPAIPVTAHSVNTNVPITVTATDNAGNSFPQSFEVVYLSIDDPTVPTGEWLCPISSAMLPANTSNYQLKLRLRAMDDISVTSVRFRLPGVEQLVVPTSDKPNEYAATVTINTPAADKTDYFITAIVTDADPAHTQEFRLRLSFVVPDLTIDSTQAIIASNLATYEDKTVLVTGPEAKLVPHVPVRFKNLIVLNGGRIETLPTTTSTERKMDVTVTGTLYIDCASTIDVTGRGYLGANNLNGDGSGTRNDGEYGRTFGNTTTNGALSAGASHGGVGVLYNVGSTNAVYGSYSEPRTLGAGGGSNSNSNGAGAGGGAIAITGSETSRFIVAGAIRANGIDGAPLQGAGAGGSVLLQSADVVLSPAARVTANGGNGIPGGGGRVAIRTTRTLTMPEHTVQARGGYNVHGEGFGYADGGAGTLYIVRPGETPGETESELRISAFNEDHPTSTHQLWPTPIGTVGGPELVFGSIYVGPRAILRIDSAYSVTKTDGLNVDPAGFLFGPEVQPTLTFSTVPAAGSTVWQNAQIVLTYDAAAGDGVANVRVSFPGRTDQVATFNSYPATAGPTNVTITVPANAVPGPVTLKISTLTRSGRTLEKTATYTVSSDASPQVVFDSVVPQTESYAGGTIAVSASATDDVEVKSLDLTSSVSGVTAQTATKPTPQSMARQFSVLVPKTTPSSTAVLLTVSASDGFPGRAATTDTRTVTVRPDTIKPIATVLAPPANQDFNESATGKITIEVQATDAEVGVNTVTATFEGTTYTLQPVFGQPGRYSVANVPIPQVDGTEPVEKTITVNVTDFEPNTQTVPVKIFIHPLIDANAPILSWICSSPNAMYPAGTAVPLRVSATRPPNVTGEFSVQRVEYTVNGGAIAPIPASTPAGEYATTFTIPAGTAPGTVFNVRVAAYSGSSNESTLVTPITVVAGTEITTARDVAATDLSLDNSTVIVRSGGVLTLTGPHTFTNLVVLDGGKVIQKHVDLANGDILTVDRLYLACNSSIDVTGQGYAPRTTYPGERAAAANGGAAHIGLGGWRADSGSTYGSIYRPREAGAGEFNRASGGGVVRIVASRAGIDGAIYANGQSNTTSNEGGAAGGSVWITASSVRGSGRIEVNGGNGAASSSTNGGAGAISIEYTDSQSTLPTLQARSGNIYNPYGGAGSIYTRGPQSTYGDLRFDNTSIPMERPAVLPALGTAVVQSVPSTGTIVLGAPASVQPYFAGHWLRVQAPDGTIRGFRRIASVTTGTQLVLDSNAGDAIEVQAGDTVRGAYRLDSLKLVNAWVETSDLVVVGSIPVLDGTSRLYTGNDAAPVIDVTKISFAMGTHGPVLVGQANAVTDTDQPVEVSLRNPARPLPADDMIPDGVEFGTVGGFSVRKIVTGTPWASTIGKRSSSVAGYVSCRPSQTNKHMDCVLHSGTPRSYRFGIFSDGQWQIWVDGQPVSGLSAYNTSTTFRIERSAGMVRWYVNGSKVREQATDAVPLFPYIAIKDDGGEINSFHYSVGSITSSRVNAAADGSFTLGVEGSGGDPIFLAARDSHYYPMSSEVSLGTIPADLGVTSLTFAPAEVTGGRPATGTVTIGRAAPLGGAVLQLNRNSTSAVVPASVTIPATQTSATFTVTTQPVTTPADATITASYGNFATSTVLKLVKDNVAPQVTITLPVANTQYTEGASSGIALEATVIEQDSGVATVVASLDGVTTNLTKNTAKGPNVYTATVPVPFIPETTNVTKNIVVTATDNNANVGDATVAVVIKPISDVTPPVLTWTCFSDGGMYPVLEVLTFSVTATVPGNNSIQGVQFFVTAPDGSTTTHTATRVGTTSEYRLQYTVPAVVDGAPFSVLARATTAGGAEVELTRTFVAVTDAVKIAASTTIAANNTTYDGKTVIVTGGTTTITGAHTFKRLIVYSGAKIVHVAGDRLDLQATNGLFVACGGSIDTTGLGYPENQSYPGTVLPGFAAGGSHIGVGGRHQSNGVASTFGSVYQPSEKGGGGDDSGPGGGVVRIVAGTVVNDGVIRANGTGGRESSAGGSIWITATTVSGMGAIEANGASNDRGGGGGAVAIQYGTATGTVLTNTKALGGSGGGAGGAGTVYLKSASSTYGTLIIDNGSITTGTTDLPSLGSGTAQSGTAGAVLVTDRTADVPAYFASHWVRVTTAAGVVKGTWRIGSMSARSVTLLPNGSETIDVQTGDLWQGIYRFDTVTQRNTLLVSKDPIETTDQTVDGAMTTSDIRTTNLRIKAGATLVHPYQGRLNIAVTNDLTIEAGAVIDATGLGYAENQSYPGAVVPGFAAGGSHIGMGGRYQGNPVASTFGSVYQPSELGGGGDDSGSGGGVVRIVAGTVTNDGVIKANGLATREGAAGGSIWITTTTLGGNGTIEAKGANNDRGGGGGAVAIEYQTATGTVLSKTTAIGGNGNLPGGAGSIYLKSPSSTYGTLIINNGTNTAGTTDLPSLGSGTAQTGTSGATLVTDRTTDVPAYFVAHWVRVSTAAGVEKGAWRIASVSGKSVTLRPNGSETIDVQTGDLWQGIYRFDTLTQRNTLLTSKDPIETTEQTIEGAMTTSDIRTTNLRIKAGATLIHPYQGRLNIAVPGELIIEAGAVIDATGLGYAENQSYPGAVVPGFAAGGSHIGMGGRHQGYPVASTFGSVYQPSELGGGGDDSGSGGGVVRIVAGTVTNDGVIKANGLATREGAAGGSIWITTTTLGGDGTIEAKGANNDRGGGGGAVAIEYQTVTGTVLSKTTAIGGNGNLPGGTGSIYLKTPSSVYGTLILNNGSNTAGITDLPSLGSGTAQTGTSGATLVTDRTANVPAYFVAHWVRVSTAAGVVKGTWRIGSVDGKSVTLLPNAGETIDVQTGDLWQGIYRFDTLTQRNIVLTSNDPIETTEQSIEGAMTAIDIRTTNLLLKTGATLTHPYQGRLNIVATGNFIIEPSAVIDANGLGYAEERTYPGATLPAFAGGGSHLGGGGSHQGGVVASTFGSVYRPSEFGAGGDDSGSGGGVVRIVSGTLTHNGLIRANGLTTREAAAGGSIWITTTTLGGTGTIEAKGGSSDRGGGGGAVAIEYGTASGTVLTKTVANGGTGNKAGGAGTIYLKSGTATYGSLRVSNAGISGEHTGMPSLGAGSAVTGTANAVVVTDRATNIPPYFAGHWVEIKSSGGTVKGLWRISTISGKTMTLAPNGTETISVEPGDVYQGVYRFDDVTLTTTRVVSADPLRSTNTIDQGTTILDVNDGAPSFPTAKRSQIVVASAVAGDKVTGPFGAVTDANGPIKLTVTNTRTAATFTANANPDGSFSVPVSGAAGDTFTISATDSHSIPLTSGAVPVNGAIVEMNTIASLTIQPSTVAGGTTVYGSVRLASPARSTGAVVSLLSSAPGLASVPVTFTIAGGAVSAQFPIVTSIPASTTEAQITASIGSSSASAPLTVTSTSSALANLTFTTATVEGGTSVTGTVVLGSPAPPGGALVLLSSDLPQAVVPSTLIVPAGNTEMTFTVTTAKVGADVSADISATWGSTKTAALTLTACNAMTVATPPSSAAMNTVWFDEAAPAGATASGEPTFDNTQSATGTLALHFKPPTTTSIRTWTFTNGAALNVAPADRLVFYALVNPCKPPRQILMQWSDGTTQYRASWGENWIDKTLATVNAGSIPAGGVWQRMEVVAKTMTGFTATKALTGLTISVDGGEAWIDAAGFATCTTAKAEKPNYLPNEIVWFDDAAPTGATLNTAYNWDTTQVASGTAADMVGSTTEAGSTQHYFSNAPNGPVLNVDDMIVAYVFLDPCNPPREVMLQFSDTASGFNRRVYWGENLIDYGGMHTVQRRRMGSLPELGKWVRLEIPVSSMQMTGTTLNGMAFTIFGGRVWFDRIARVSRVNLALGKPAGQSSTYLDNADLGAYRVVDGNAGTDAHNHTKNDPNSWWEVDLGAVQPIDSIDVWNLAQCCGERLQNFWLFVSDKPFASTNLAATIADADVTGYYYLRQATRTESFQVSRSGRYVRVQLASQNYLHMSEVQVWAPVIEQPVNLAPGRVARQSSTHISAYTAALAVNGNVIGESESHTSSELEAFWQVDLGSVQSISSIDIDNAYAGDAWMRMSNFYVFVSDTKFPASDKLADVLTHAGVSAFYRTGPLSAYKVDVNRRGQYIRIQLTGTNYLHPMEVRVWSPSLSLSALAKTPARF
jgi:hypothetical protein